MFKELREKNDMEERLVLFGDEVGLEAMERSLEKEKDFSPMAVVYSAGRIQAKPIAEKLASKYHCEIIEQPSGKSEKYDEFVNAMSMLRPTLGICYSYDKIIKKEVLSLFQKGIFNLHGALLPKYRGGSVLNWVLIYGETKTGMTIHQMVEKVDAGPIALQKEVLIDVRDTAVTLREKLNNAAIELLPQFWQMIKEEKLILKEQEEAEVTYVRCRKPEDGRFSWNQKAEEIYNLIRALVYPWPGAWYVIGSEKHIIQSFMEYEEVVNMKQKFEKSEIDINS